MVNLDLEISYVTSLFVEAILYGIFVVCFCISTVVLYQRNARTRGIWCLFATSVAMFLIGTIHMAINSYRILSPKLRNPETGEVILILSSPAFVLRNATYVAQTLLGDGFLLYRLYVTWGGSKLVCLPFLLSLLACVGVGVVTFASPITAGDKKGVVLRGFSLIIFYALTLFTDLSCSLLIGARIWWIHRKTQRSGATPSPLMRVAIIILESGVIYSICLAFLLALWLAKTNQSKIVLDGVTQLIGVVFCVIIIRVGNGVSTGDHATVLNLDTLHFTQDQHLTAHTRTSLDEDSQLRARPASAKGIDGDLHLV